MYTPNPNERVMSAEEVINFLDLNFEAVGDGEKQEPQTAVV
jgi:hypothetical protein